MLRALRKVLLSPSLQGAMIFAMSGGAFALGNLLLAHALTVSAYGHFALMVAILIITSNMGPLGLDQLLLRSQRRLGGHYLAPIILSSALIALAGAWIASRLYGVIPAAAIAIACASLMFALLRTAACALRRHGVAIIAIFCDTAADWGLLCVGIAALAGWIVDEEQAALALAGFGGIAAIAAYSVTLRRERTMASDTAPLHFAEAFPLLGIIAAGAVLVQAERLLIPPLLSLEDLATFAVLTSVAIAPFRVLSAGIVASLTPQLRKIHDIDGQRKLLMHEIRIFAALAAISTIIVCVIAPPFADIFTQGRYVVGIGLCLAACVNGTVKILQAVPRAVATGIGTAGDLHRVNLSMWLCVLGTVIGALACARWGLTALVLGAALGSGIATLPSIAMVRKKLARPGTPAAGGDISAAPGLPPSAAPR